MFCIAHFFLYASRRDRFKLQIGGPCVYSALNGKSRSIGEAYYLTNLSIARRYRRRYGSLNGRGLRVGLAARELLQRQYSTSTALNLT